MRVTLESKDQIWLDTGGHGDIGCAWYNQRDGYLQRADQNPHITVSRRGQGYDVCVRLGNLVAVVSINPEHELWMETCRRFKPALAEPHGADAV